MRVKRTLIMETLLCAVLIVGLSNQVNAATGRLVQDSVAYCESDGSYYGYHTSKGETHYHTAVKETGSYWMAGEKEPLGTSNPCYEVVAEVEEIYEEDSGSELSSNDVNTDNYSNSSASSSNQSQSSTNNSASHSNTEVASNYSSSSNNVITSTDSTAAIKKSDVKTLEKLKINDKEVDISDVVSLEVNTKNIKIEAVATDENATVNMDNIKELAIGNNEVKIEVVAENTNAKTYTLNIYRLNDDTGVTITINDKDVKFDDNHNAEISLSSSADKIDIDYKLNDDNALITLDYNETISSGKNIVVLKVTAENGDVQTYTVIVEKTPLIFEIIGGGIGLLFLYGIYKIYKKGKQKKIHKRRTKAFEI